MPQDNIINNDSSNELKEITENLYKRNLELAVKNKTLSLLRQLYQISLLILEPLPLTEKIVKTVQSSLELELVGIYLFNANNKIVPLNF